MSAQLPLTPAPAAPPPAAATWAPSDAQLEAMAQVLYERVQRDLAEDGFYTRAVPLTWSELAPAVRRYWIGHVRAMLRAAAGAVR